MGRKVQIILSIILIMTAIAGLALIVVLRDTANHTATPADTRQQGSSQQTTNGNADTAKPKTYHVKVYFSKHPESDDDPTKVYAFTRTSPDLGLATFAVKQLISGPTNPEKAAGYFTDVRVRNDASNCGNADFTLSIKDAKATLRFCRTFDAVGTLSDGRANETIRATLLQFPTVKSVVVLSKDGHCQFDMSGEDRCMMQ